MNLIFANVQCAADSMLRFPAYSYITDAIEAFREDNNMSANSDMCANHTQRAVMGLPHLSHLTCAEFYSFLWLVHKQPLMGCAFP